MPEFLLRFCEGAAVLLYRHEPHAQAENVPTRVDLFEYPGGYAWGYGGSGPNALSHAIAGKLFELVPLSRNELAERASVILKMVVSHLEGATEHTIPLSRLAALFPDDDLNDIYELDGADEE